jgi:DNA-binding CsgD family transcriptional regulator
VATLVRSWFRYPDYPPEASISVFNSFMHQHPLFRYWDAHGASTAKWSDFITLRQLREKAIYREYFRYAEVNYQLGTASMGGTSGNIGVACNRYSCDFTEDERQLLEMMTPHFEQALKLANGRYALAQVRSSPWVTGNLRAAMIVSDAGEVLFQNEKAEGLWQKFFANAHGVPAKIAYWLRNDFHRPLSIPAGEEILLLECEVAQPAQLVESEISTGVPRGEVVYLLRLTERSATPERVKLQSLGLTPREAEVLSWMAHGKRNAEIAVILGMQPSTVAKHAERIYEKLEVENRTTAIARAWETLGS